MRAQGGPKESAGKPPEGARHPTMSTDTNSEPDEINTAIEQGHFHRLRVDYPAWIPRTFVLPSRQVLEALETGLERRLS